MISVDEALKTILEKTCVLEAEEVPLLEALGKALAGDIYSPNDIPPFTNSAMDGYAVIAEDTYGASKEKPVVLEIIEDLPAGAVPSKKITRGKTSKIMTGAVFPEGADSVVIVEETESFDGRVKIFSPVEKGENIRLAGEDVKRDSLVLKKGTYIKPAVVGMLASLGLSMVKVMRKPKVAIIATGDELIEPGEKLTPGKIRNSNSYSIAAQVIQLGAEPVNLGIARDNPGDIERKIKEGLSKGDILITSAGVSVGEYDFVKNVMKKIGVEPVFWRIAMRPGKPLSFGLYGKKPVFGLPGNPTSSMISFDQFVSPAILKMAGFSDIKRRYMLAVLKEDIKKRKDLRHFIRVILSEENGEWTASTTGPQGSGILTSMVLANGLLILPEELEIVKAGTKLPVQLID